MRGKKRFGAKKGFQMDIKQRLPWPDIALSENSFVRSIEQGVQIA